MKTSSGVAPLRVCLMGVTIEMDAPDEATRARLAHQWSRAVVEGDGRDEPVARISVTRGVSDDDHARDYALTTQLTMTALVATQGQRINLHAGGLGDDRGRVLALVGASGSGKTTATRLLAQRLAYLSDETVSIGNDLEVSAHPKPLSVIVDPGNPLHKVQLSPDDLGLLPTPRTGTLERLVMLHRGAGGRGLVRLDTVTAMRELIAQSSSLREVPQPLETLLQLIHDCGGVWALEYDEIGEHLDELVRLLAEEQPPPDDPQVEQRRHLGVDDTGMDEIAAGLICRVPWLDALEIGSELVVLLGSRAVHLADVTASIWLELATPRTLDELVDAVRLRHGDHPDARSIVESGVATLVEEDVLALGWLE